MFAKNPFRSFTTMSRDRSLSDDDIRGCLLYLVICIKICVRTTWFARFYGARIETGFGGNLYAKNSTEVHTHFDTSGFNFLH